MHWKRRYEIWNIESHVWELTIHKPKVNDHFVERIPSLSMSMRSAKGNDRFWKYDGFAENIVKAVLMLVKNACWRKTFILVKNFHHHSTPKYHDVGKNVGEILCWRKKICSFKIICMLVNYVDENFSVCWRKVFSLVKYVCWWSMYVGHTY